MKKKFKKEELIECFWEDETENLKTIEKEDWVSEGKYDYTSMIFKELETDKIFSFGVSRSGSYFTDYDYDWEYEPEEIECSEVEKVEVVTHEWKVVSEKAKT